MRSTKTTLLLFFLFFLSSFTANGQDTPPDTVRTGVYVTSIYDIDFRQREYSINLWL